MSPPSVPFFFELTLVPMSSRSASFPYYVSLRLDFPPVSFATDHGIGDFLCDHKLFSFLLCFERSLSDPQDINDLSVDNGG